MPLKTYAIGLAKGWVEIRRASTPPKAIISNQSIKIAQPDRKEIYFNEASATWKIKAVKSRPKQVSIEVVIHKGGKVIGILTSRRFASQTKIKGLKVGDMIELSEDQAMRVGV